MKMSRRGSNVVISLVNNANYDVTIRVWGKDAKVEHISDVLREYGLTVAKDAESKKENALRLYIVVGCVRRQFVLPESLVDKLSTRA